MLVRAKNFLQVQRIHKGLSINYLEDVNLREGMISAVQGHPAFTVVILKPADTFESVCSELRSAVCIAHPTGANKQTPWRVADTAAAREESAQARAQSLINTNSEGGALEDKDGHNEPPTHQSLLASRQEVASFPNKKAHYRRGHIDLILLGLPGNKGCITIPAAQLSNALEVAQPYSITKALGVLLSPFSAHIFNLGEYQRKEDELVMVQGTLCPWAFRTKRRNQLYVEES
ncbi:hypothetical protein F4819DRAFT_490311 [Hypoxylon fuscum]|nr:hypothetical protein F4819DRAFT_490311 [Hypoxylon fuscum]